MEKREGGGVGRQERGTSRVSNSNWEHSAGCVARRDYGKAESYELQYRGLVFW